MSQNVGTITLRPKGPPEEIEVSVRRTWQGDLRTLLTIFLGGTFGGVASAALCKLIW